MISGVTLDTGVLLALESRSYRAWSLWSAWTDRRLRRTVPAAVLAEWWRSRTPCANRILQGIRVEPLDHALARMAGEALGRVANGPSVVDAVVMASAAQRGDVVYTGDIRDLQRLQSEFPEVRLMSL